MSTTTTPRMKLLNGLLAIIVLLLLVFFVLLFSANLPSSITVALIQSSFFMKISNCPGRAPKCTCCYRSASTIYHPPDVLTNDSDA
ncbi:hypothetical protein D917_04969 [Trichinella nativa]|uniref:Uncharacterized protein n=1 Tax=Trichinella nativa TaxID=6335 RepID=A0A1Y3F190_9BILA|nr:hypothetical protein D917_04969 [Trichinella nativa]